MIDTNDKLLSPYINNNIVTYFPPCFRSPPPAAKKSRKKKSKKNKGKKTKKTGENVIADAEAMALSMLGL